MYTLVMILVIRIGTQLPVPGSKWTAISLKNGFQAKTGGAFDFLMQFTGGSFTKMSVFALNITPNITSSIIMQLLRLQFRNWKNCREMEKKDSKENDCHHTLGNCWSCVDGVSGNGNRFG